MGDFRPIHQLNAIPPPIPPVPLHTAAHHSSTINLPAACRRRGVWTSPTDRVRRGLRNQFTSPTGGQFAFNQAAHQSPPPPGWCRRRAHAHVPGAPSATTLPPFRFPLDFPFSPPSPNPSSRDARSTRDSGHRLPEPWEVPATRRHPSTTHSQLLLPTHSSYRSSLSGSERKATSPGGCSLEGRATPGSRAARARPSLPGHGAYETRWACRPEPSLGRLTRAARRLRPRRGRRAVARRRTTRP